MKTLLITCIIGIGIFISCSKNPVSQEKNCNDLEHIQPEEAGWSTEKLNDIIPAIEQSSYAAVMAIYDGRVFFSWGNTSRNYKCHSIRKPFLSALYGIHVERGNIDLDKTLAELNIDDIPPSLTNEEKQATVRDLLKSRSGVYHEAAAEDQVMIDTRPERGSHLPNTFYFYNNWDFNALGTIFEQETGTKIFEEFKRKIADPIGMQDFDVNNCYYQYEWEKSMHPAYHFRMSARDMARFGVLFQKDGRWNNSQIVSTEWITESTTSYSVKDSTFGIGYGYMWDVIPEGSLMAENIGYTGYYHTGIGVHALIIVPELNLVIVQRYDTDGNWTDPGEIGFEIGMMIINARSTDK